MRKQIRSKEANEQLQSYHLNLSKKEVVEVLEEELLFINHQPAFFRYETRWVPTLKYLREHSLLKKITVDLGAIKFIISGADIMRPGLTEIELGIVKNDFVVIVDQINKKPIAVGMALFSSEEMQAMTTGKVVKNIHHVDDEMWKKS